MRFRELRRVLQTIVLAGLGGCTVAGSIIDGGDDGDCYKTTIKKFTLDGDAADPPLTLRIESCRVDVDACMRLCTLLMTRASLPAPQTCAVSFSGDTTHATASYTEATGNAGCGTEGRRPAGLVEPRHIDALDAVGRWL